jgi:hypothetical protein
MIYSYSSLKAYEMCKRKFFFQFIEKVPVEQTEALSFGSVVHAILQEAYNNLQSTEILSYNTIKPFILKHSMSVNKDLGIKIDELFKNIDYSTLVPLKYKKISKFETQIYLDKDFKRTKEYYRAKFMGVVDALFVVPEERKIIIVDYKTSNSTWVDWTQLKLYKYLANKSLLETAPIDYFDTRFIFLKHNKVEQSVFTRDEIDAQIENYLTNLIESADADYQKYLELKEEGVENVHEIIYFPTKNKLCDWCPFNSSCPALKVKEENNNQWFI